MTVKLHGHAELSQYKILDLFVIQYISESRNINIDLYKGDNIYALGSIEISRQRSNCIKYLYNVKRQKPGYKHHNLFHKLIQIGFSKNP